MTYHANCNIPHARTIKLQIQGVVRGTHVHNPWTIGGPTVRPASPWHTTWDPSQKLQENYSNCWPTAEPTDRRLGHRSSLCLWIRPFVSSPQSWLMVDQNGPSVDQWSAGPVRQWPQQQLSHGSFSLFLMWWTPKLRHLIPKLNNFGQF